MEPIDLGFIFFRQSSYPVISRLSRTALIHLRQTSQTANHSTNIHFYFSRSAEYRPAKTANTWEKRTRSLGLTLPQQFRRFRSNTKRASYSLLSRNIPPCIYLCTCIFLRWMKKTYSTPVDPGDFVSTVGLTGINSAGMNIEAIPNKVVLCILVFCMATFCVYYCLASSLHRFNKTT